MDSDGPSQGGDGDELVASCILDTFSTTETTSLAEAEMPKMWPQMMASGFSRGTELIG